MEVHMPAKKKRTRKVSNQRAGLGKKVEKQEEALLAAIGMIEGEMGDLRLTYNDNLRRQEAFNQFLINKFDIDIEEINEFLAGLIEEDPDETDPSEDPSPNEQTSDDHQEPQTPEHSSDEEAHRS
jgi:hypothetical protein